jgi:hypothetical protein
MKENVNMKCAFVRSLAIRSIAVIIAGMPPVRI